MANGIPIQGVFSDKDLESPQFTKTRSQSASKSQSPFVIPPHPGFEQVELPNGDIYKLAYNNLYAPEVEDLEIELDQIAHYEPMLRKTSKVIWAKRHLKFHYKRAISIISRNISEGWNLWSDYILELFINERTHKILWGSGNCGKSIVFAALLYTKWRVRPDQRMVVIATKIVKDASARVFGYIKQIHLNAPESSVHRFNLVDSTNNKAIYCQIYDNERNRWINDDIACIINLSIKTRISGKDEKQLGDNLMGKHPKDRLILAFDEGQELPGRMLSEKIFLNWYTNERLDIYAWGNPIAVEFHAPAEWDLLFRIGVGSNPDLRFIRRQEKNASKTSVWYSNDTAVLHLSMLDSPKDDPIEKLDIITRPDGTKVQRLHFLAGKDNADLIAQDNSSHSPAWYSQVLGFPWIDSAVTKHPGVLSPAMINVAQQYSLMWKTPEHELVWGMSVDPSLTGYGDPCAIIIGRMGMMMDKRIGIDLMHGKHCTHVKPIEDQDFTDTIIEVIHTLSKRYKISLKNISIETHGTGEVVRYGMQRHIEEGKWAEDVARGETFHIHNPVIPITERSLFKTLGKMLPASKMVTDIITEYYVAVRCAVLTRQLFNIPEFALKQFFNRRIDYTPSGKFKVESKEDLRKRGFKSPNDADALCGLVDMFRHRGFNYSFYKHANYKMYFGPEFDAQEENILIRDRLNTVSSLLQTQVNLGRYIGNTGSDDRRIPMNVIGSV